MTDAEIDALSNGQPVWVERNGRRDRATVDRVGPLMVVVTSWPQGLRVALYRTEIRDGAVTITGREMGT